MPLNSAYLRLGVRPGIESIRQVHRCSSVIRPLRIPLQASSERSALCCLIPTLVAWRSREVTPNPLRGCGLSQVLERLRLLT